MPGTLVVEAWAGTPSAEVAVEAVAGPAGEQAELSSPEPGPHLAYINEIGHHSRCLHVRTPLGAKRTPNTHP